MKNMTIRQEIRKAWDDTKFVAAGVLAIGAVYLGATLAVNAVAVPTIAAVNGLERAVGAKKHEGTARLVDKGHYSSPNAEIDWGKFVFSDGRETALYDICDFPSEKFLPSGDLRNADLGKTYQVTSLEGPISYKLISLKE
jgi:hypothetical protein